VPDRIEPRSPSAQRFRAGKSGTGGLKAFLSGPAKPADALSFHEAQGFLFAVVAAPDVVPPSEWVPMVLGQGRPAFASGAQAQRLLGQLMTLYNGLVEDVTRNKVKLPEECRVGGDALSDLIEDAPLSQWCRGFARGHSWLERSWTETSPHELQEELAALLVTMSFFASRRLAEGLRAECTGGKKSLEEMAKMCRDVLPDAMARYAQLGQAIRQATTSASSHDVERVGRNDPCPCGSGKKSKRCCGAAPADLMEQAARRIRRIQSDVEPRVVAFARSRGGPGAVERAREEFACGHAGLEPGGPEDQLFHPWLPTSLPLHAYD
jgi:uncharacterized protein